MDDALKAKLDEVEKSMVETYELALTYGDDAAKNTNSFQQIFEKVIEIRNQASHCDQALEKAKNHTTIEDLEREYVSEMGKVKSFDAKKTKDYKAFQSRLKQIKDTFDNQSTDAGSSHSNRMQTDDIVMETQIQVLDPLTKRQMEDPVKNKICGHNYEKSAILQAIKINPRLRCPVAGCGNNQFIKANHLVDDDALRMHIMNREDTGSDDNDDPLAL